MPSENVGQNEENVLMPSANKCDNETLRNAKDLARARAWRLLLFGNVRILTRVCRLGSCMVEAPGIALLFNKKIIKFAYNFLNIPKRKLFPINLNIPFG